MVAVGRLYVPAGVMQLVAFPLAVIPCATVTPLHSVGVAASAVAVPAMLIGHVPLVPAPFNGAFAARGALMPVELLPNGTEARLIVGVVPPLETIGRVLETLLTLPFISACLSEE